jgi:DUF4097 and DUF4098 domain-containing protein YvlB
MAIYSTWSKTILGICVLPLLATPGCVIHLSNWSGSSNQVTYERTATQEAPRGTSSTLDVQTESGSIAITGADTETFTIEARIAGHAPTEEEAKELAEQVEITAAQVGDTLRVRAKKPELKNNRSVSVSYTISSPRRVNVDCHSSYGSVSVADIEGTVNGKSTNGSIKAENIQGATDLDTSYGSITCNAIAGKSVTLRSTNGSITIADCKGTLKANTSYGSVACRQFSDGDLSLKSTNGRIELTDASFGSCDVDTSYGLVACARVKGDRVKLQSGNGNMELNDAQAGKIEMSTSYGGIKAGQITTGDLTARSGNGSVNVTCSTACPPDLKADVKSSYGSITFTAPPAFAGQVRLSTSYGSVRTARPVTMSGEIDKKNIRGTIGQGAGSIHLETGNGSIELK